jgi:hypothetical protein
MRDKPLLFVDTNILLDFYRARGEAGLSLLRHIESVLDVLIMTDQIEAEFLNNRQKVISEALKEFAIPEMKVVVPAYLQETKAVKAIGKGKAQIKKAVETLKQRFAKLLEDPAKNDPVFKIVRRAFASDNSISLKARGEETRAKILQAALVRFQRGFPPRKKQESTTGDAINWEWILHCAKTFEKEVLIVSRDSDFGLFERGLLNDWLAQEFKDATRRKAHLVPSLTQALEKLGITVTADEEREENRIIEKAKNGSLNPHGNFPVFWPRVLETVERRSSAIFCNLTHATSVTYASDKLTIYFGFNDLKSLREAENGGCRDLLQEIFRDFQFAPLKEITFANDIWTEFDLEPQSGFAKTITCH